MRDAEILKPKKILLKKGKTKSGANRFTKHQPLTQRKEIVNPSLMIVTVSWILHQEVALMTLMRAVSSMNKFYLFTHEEKHVCNAFNLKCGHSYNPRRKKIMYVCATTANTNIKL